MFFCDFFGVTEGFRWILGEGRRGSAGPARETASTASAAAAGSSSGVEAGIPAAAAVPGTARGHMAVNRERVLATRQAGDVLLGGASGAGSLLLNTKASQEAACSRAPAAIVPVRA